MWCCRSVVSSFTLVLCHKWLLEEHLKYILIVIVCLSSSVTCYAALFTAELYRTDCLPGSVSCSTIYFVFAYMSCI